MTDIEIFDNKKKKVNLEKFIETRGLICANSGGGKSYAIRKILEESHGKVMSIVLDVEGEFKTLREKYDFLLIGNDGDVNLSSKAAKLLPEKILELNVSTIIDISELKRKYRIQYVKDFLEALMELPRKLWKPCIVIVDEAHLYCGQQEKQDSYAAVIDLMTRGRKRGFCGILCTQRIAKLHKDAVAEANNVLMGRTWMDVDQNRASEILGFTSKQDKLSLRDLDAGEFYVFGTAISNIVDKEKIAKVKTVHPKGGMDIGQNITQPTDKIKAILSKISDLPEEEEKKIQKERDYLKEINELKRDLHNAEKNVKIVPSEQEYKKGFRDAEVQYKTQIVSLEKNISTVTSKLSKIGLILEKPIDLEYKREYTTIKKEIVKQSPSYKQAPLITELSKDNDGDIKISGGSKRMLNAAAMFHPKEITKMRMAAISGLSYKSGTFGTYLGVLKAGGLIEASGNGFVATAEGMAIVGDVVPLPTDSDSLINMWCGIIKGGASRMLKSLADKYPERISKEELGSLADISYTSGTFGTYLGTLKRNGLIENNSEGIKVSDELFE